jgi:hypothetical protein
MDTQEVAIEALRRIPLEYFASIARYSSGHIEIGVQCSTQAAIKAVRVLFPGTVWKKEPRGDSWSYTGEYNGVAIRLYACEEAPEGCRLVKYTVELPAREAETVTKYRWDCGSEQ